MLRIIGQDGWYAESYIYFGLVMFDLRPTVMAREKKARGREEAPQGKSGCPPSKQRVHRVLHRPRAPHSNSTEARGLSMALPIALDV